MFRRKQKLNMANSYVIYAAESQFNKDGSMVTELVAQNRPLPSADMFDLGEMIDAGIDQDEVSSKVIGAKSVNADNVVRKYVKKSSTDEEK